MKFQFADARSNPVAAIRQVQAAVDGVRSPQAAPFEFGKPLPKKVISSHGVGVPGFPAPVALRIAYFLAFCAAFASLVTISIVAFKSDAKIWMFLPVVLIRPLVVNMLPLRRLSLYQAMVFAAVFLLHDIYVASTGWTADGNRFHLLLLIPLILDLFFSLFLIASPLVRLWLPINPEQPKTLRAFLGFAKEKYGGK